MAAIEEQAFRLTADDGTSVACWRWSKPVTPRAVLQVAHGMGEHALRYKPALEALMDDGVIVYANDHRGHGRTAPSEASLGDFGEGGFPALVSDMALLTDHARKEDRNLPLVLMGHSMGSFAAQLYVLDHADRIDGLVISGSAAFDHLAQALPDDPDAEGLSAFEGLFEPQRTPFDWLSRDDEQVDLYIADPLCGFSVVPAGMASMGAALLPRTADPAMLDTIPKNLPVYVFSGDKDPVGGPDLAFLEALVQRYRDAGLTVKTHFYPDGRHEMLNEINRAEVVGHLADRIRTIGPRT